MATVPKHAGFGLQARASEHGAREPQLFRFGLRRLLWFVAVAAVVCALLARSGGPWPLIIGMAVALVAAHVLGNLVGTRLRDTSREVQQWKAERMPGGRDDPVATPEPVRFGELSLPMGTPLALYGRAWRFGNWAVAAGAMLGLALGLAGMRQAAGQQITWLGLAVGAVSCGAIGAWAAMLVTNFWLIVRGAWRAASRDQGEEGAARSVTASRLNDVGRRG